MCMTSVTLSLTNSLAFSIRVVILVQSDVLLITAVVLEVSQHVMLHSSPHSIYYYKLKYPFLEGASITRCLMRRTFQLEGFHGCTPKFKEKKLNELEIFPVFL